MNAFEQRLKELRNEKQLTQKQLADQLNTTDDSIYAWEKGRSQPSIEFIIKLCKIFEVSADYLLGLEDETGAKIYVSAKISGDLTSDERHAIELMRSTSKEGLELMMESLEMFAKKMPAIK